jgi:iron complex outermembrane recepter protein
MKTSKSFYSTSVSAIALALGCCVSGQTAQAQSTEMETVVVTATGTNISGITQVGSESISLDRDKILSTGMTSVTDVLRQLPQVSNLGDMREGGTAGYGFNGNGSNQTSGTAINLRGLGAQATLTLVDGHRLAPSGTAGTFTEANQVPIAALSRVEIITDGNSAIYGSDAVGGVVNFVLRKDFEGVELSGRSTFVDGYNEYGASLTAGHVWEHLGGMGAGNFILSYDYDYRENMPASSRAILSSNLTAFGGIDNRISGGASNNGVGAQTSSTATAVGVPGNIVACATYAYGSCTSWNYYGLPKGTNTSLTSANLSTTPNLADNANYNDYLGRMWRHQIVGFINQDITPWLNAYFEGFFTKRETVSRGLQTTSAVCLPTTSPYYVSGITSAAGYTCSTGPSSTDKNVSGVLVQYNFAKDLGNYVTTNPDETYTLVYGLKAKLPYEWNGEFNFTNALDQTCGICQFGINADVGAFQHLVASGEINPLSSDPLSKTEIAKFTGDNVQRSRNMVNHYVMKFDGPLFELPGGTVKAAIGGEYTYATEHLANGANRSQGEQSSVAQVPTQDNEFIWDNVTGLSRSIWAGFAEVYIPVIGEKNAVPFVEELNADLAIRHDEYSDFGGTTNPKIGVTWKMNQDITARGSWGTAFRAPNLTDINPYVFSVKAIYPTVNNSGDSSIKNAFGNYAYNLFLYGARSGLNPEKAENWSVGIDLTPHWLDGFRFSTTYYNIKYKDQIGYPPNSLFLSNSTYRALYSNYITPIDNTGCVAGNESTYDPKILPFLKQTGVYGSITASAICQVTVVLDGRITNLSSTHQEGLDWEVSYGFDTAIGAFNVGATASTVLNDKITVVDGSTPIQVANTIGYPVKWRGRGNILWMSGPWSANLFVNYVGTYKNNQTFSGSVDEVSDWTTFDAGATYQFGKDVFWSGMKDVRLSLNVQNLFDRDPPVVIQSNYSGFDPHNANVFGRIVTLQLTKDF